MSFSFITGATGEEASSAALPLFREYAWDFEHDCFLYKDGKHIVVTGREALKVWIYKTLKTERYRYLAYDGAYGIELEQFQGRRPNDAEAASEVKRYVEEALLVNPYIEELTGISWTNEADILEMEITAKTVYGEVTQGV